LKIKENGNGDLRREEGKKEEEKKKKNENTSDRWKGEKRMKKTTNLQTAVVTKRICNFLLLTQDV
jgi:hypothetical protein